MKFVAPATSLLTYIPGCLRLADQADHHRRQDCCRFIEEQGPERSSEFEERIRTQCDFAKPLSLLFPWRLAGFQDMMCIFGHESFVELSSGSSPRRLGLWDRGQFRARYWERF